MKKILYFLLLIVELVVGLILMNLIWATTLYIPCLVTAIIWAILIVWQIVLLTKAKDAVAKRKYKRNIALVMLIPTAVFIITLIWFIVALMFAI